MAKGLSNGQIKALLEKNIGNINQRFWKELDQVNIVYLIKGLILKGISPVAGAVGRFQKYSQSYIDQIKGKVAFWRTKNNKVVAFRPLENKELRDYRASKEAKLQNKANQQWVKDRAQKEFNGKKQSPVNMTKSGKMMSTLSYNSRTGKITADHELWNYHNDGEGNLPERRLLPNRDGELFNRRIQQKITESLAKAMGIKAGKVKKFMKVKFDIR